MDSEWRQARRDPRRRELARRRRRAFARLSRLAAAGAMSVALLAGCGRSMPTASAPPGSGGAAHELSSASTHGLASTSSSAAASGAASGKPGTESAPILMYHVINPPPPGAPFPGLYVSASEFAAQMQALAHAGYHPVTLDQLHSYWQRGTPLPAGKPLVLTFDNGYQSQYTNALPVLRRLGWIADENIQLTGLPPSQGGLSESQVRGLVAAGWELDTQGFSHADLITLDPTELAYQVAGARKVIQRRYGVPVNWFCYPSGHYNAAVVAEVRAAGYQGSTTVVPGWAGPGSDPYRLPRLRVLGGTSPEALLSEIAGIRSDPPPAPSYPA
jgi:peptidoglycan/xylan/chitin deacetylase (PgdA/CDA1 family)